MAGFDQRRAGNADKCLIVFAAGILRLLQISLKTNT